MPTYTFQCCGCQASHEEIVSVEDRDRSRDCPSCKQLLTCVRVFEPTMATIVPAWMSATRSGASEKQAEYLKSDKHRKNMEQAERIQDRASSAKQRFDHFKNNQLDDRVERAKAGK